MGTCSSLPHGTIVSINYADYMTTTDYKLYQKAHPQPPRATEAWTDMMKKLGLPYICRKQTFTFKAGLTSLPLVADLCVGFHMQHLQEQSEPLTYRVLVDDHELLPTRPVSSEPILFSATAGNYRSCLYYTPSAEESPTGMVVLTEALPLKALQSSPIRLELSAPAIVDLLLVELPADLQKALQKNRGRIHLNARDWIYDPLTVPGFFPDLPV
jgi:hypothetical protein